jgi:carbonic anhydrase/acetyltransferase-like protein (isoleucine patch superfamily)
MSIHRVESVYMADTARVLGQVDIGRDVSIWYGAVVRGDVAPISIGYQTNVQDNAVIHCDSGQPNEIGARVTIGHAAVVHGKRVGENTLIGMHATVLSRSVIGRNCLIAAGALVPPDMEVPDGTLVVGVPGKVQRTINQEEQQYLDWLAPHYAELAQYHYESPEDPAIQPWARMMAMRGYRGEAGQRPADD